MSGQNGEPVIPNRRPVDGQTQWWAEEAKRNAELDKASQQMGIQANTEPTGEPGVADSLAYLYSLNEINPKSAIKAAQKLTGRTDIMTYEEAVQAVRDSQQG